MNKIALAILCFVLFPAFTTADVPRPKVRGTIDDAFSGGGARAYCSLVYHNACSGYTWIYGNWLAGDEIAVYFDLPTDCGSLPGGTSTNTHFNWYWSITEPGRGFLIDYRMYAVDGSRCKVGNPIGENLSVDPTHGWNHYSGLGSTTADKIVITATWRSDGPPHAVSDNNEENQAYPCGSIPVEIHSYFYGNPGSTAYCPPLLFSDRDGPVNILMNAGFNYQEGEIESASWGSIKSLFR